jgi:RNA polymerase sigma-70 factor (ECF subfamily)
MGTLEVARIGDFKPVAPARQPSNRQLLAAYRQGDRQAAEMLVEATYPGVFAGLCRLCGDRSLAADLTQETYRKAWQSLDKFAGRSQVATWLFRIAYTTFLNHLRGSSRWQSLEESAVVLVDLSPTQGEVLAQREEAAVMRSTVLKLPSRLRDVVVARYWGEIPVREIARQEGVTSVAIRKRLKKALALISELRSEQLEEAGR